MHAPTKPSCTLMGTDGNVFALLGKVLTALRQANQHAQAEDVQTRFFWCKSYDEAVQLFLEYVSITQPCTRAPAARRERNIQDVCNH